MNETFMKEKPVLPLLLSMALPNVVSMLVNSLYNIVDSLFVARISEDAMTALSLVFPIQNFSNAIAIGFGIGINAMIALYLGAGDREKAEIAATHGFVLSLVHGVVMMAVTIAIYVWQKIKDYLTKAGTVIFIASILMWAILNFGPHGYVTDISESFGSVIGRLIVPVFQPVGLGYWQIIVALIAGIAAKEVVVSSCSVLFGIQNITTAHGMTAMVASLGAIGFGPANAYALMTFCLLYVPCTATIATIHRELQSWKSTGFILLYHFHRNLLTISPSCSIYIS